MKESQSEEKDPFTFYKNAMMRPKINIESNIYVSVWNNIGFLLLLFLLTGIVLYLAYIPIIMTSDGFEEYAGMGILVVWIGLIAYLLLIPVMLVHIFVLHFLNKKYSKEIRSFEQVFSDHTTTLVFSFLLYSIGLYFYSYLETLRPYASLAGTLIIFLSIVLYIRRSIFLVTYYVKEKNKKVVYFYATVLIATVICGLPFFMNYVQEGFFEQLLISIQMLLEDVGFL